MILANTYPYTGNGLGGLPDAIEAVVSHEINGIYELMFRYPVTGLHFDDLANGNIVMAEPDALTSAQPFRIYRITKPLNGVVTVYARHICYDMQGIICEPFTATDLTTAFQTIPTKLTPANSFNFSTTRTVATGMSIVEPRPLWKLLGGQAGSILDVYGGEWDFDGYDAKLVTQLGTDRGVRVSYGKNMTELEQDGTIEGTYSGVYPYWYDEESSTLVTIPEKFVTVAGAEVSDRVFVLDCSDDWDTAPSAQDLRDKANAYILANSVGNAKHSWKVSFADNPELMMDRVMLGDTLHVRYERIGVDATARAVKTEYDVLAKHYKAITVGRVKQNLAAIIAQQNEAIENAPTQSDLEKAQQDATDFIRNGAGYMRFIYNANEELTEIVSLDDPDISQATNVWRWNNGGFGFSSTGYNGTYSLAITQNGAIVADFITAGTLNANVIKAGILQDAANKNSWNMTTGALTITDGSLNITTSSAIYDIIRLNWNNGVNNVTTNIWAGGVTSRDNNSKIDAEHSRWGFAVMKYTIDGSQSFPTASLSNGVLQLGGNSSSFPNEGSGVSGSLFVENSMGQTVATIQPSGNYEIFDTNGVTRSRLAGGFLYLFDSNGTQRQVLDGEGKLWQYDANGKMRTYLEYGDIYLYTSAEKNTLHLSSGGYASVLNTSGKTAASMGVYNDQHGYLYLYDGTSNTLRAWLDYTGLKFADANGTLTAEYPSAKTNATVSNAYMNKPLVFMRSGNTVTMLIRDPQYLPANMTLDLGVIIPAGFRPYIQSGVSYLSSDLINPGTQDTIRVFVASSGQMLIYNYSSNSGITNINGIMTWAAA